MKMTLLELVQSTLNAMSSDTVVDIAETEESNDVSSVCREVYYEFINREQWEFLRRPVVLTTTSALAKAIADTIRKFEYISYNRSNTAVASYQELKYMEPSEFLRTFSASGTNRVLVTVGSTLKYYGSTDRMPTWYTSIDENTLLFDSYDSSVDATGLDLTKFSISAYIIPTFTLSNAFTPDLPAHLFPLYLAEIKSTCFQYFKQTASIPDEKKTGRQLAQARNQSSRVHPKQAYYISNFGRR